MNVSLLGASGYTGMELALLVDKHPVMQLQGVYVSEHSQDADKGLWQLDNRFYQTPFTSDELKLTALTAEQLEQVAKNSDIIFLATPHEFSHDICPKLLQYGAKVLDLSGAFRLKETQVFAQNYGFAHNQQSLLDGAVYGLAEWYADEIKQAQLIAVPGCYPTASLLALKPLQAAGLIDSSVLPVINATSGVSGAGRKATMTNSLCEVSLQAYGVLSHRHQPEIASYLDNQVIFNPHLGNFKRGILATITLKLTAEASQQAIDNAFHSAYDGTELVNLVQQWPKLDQVVHSPKCHLHWQYSEQNHYIVVSSAIDNLLKGAASQAMQCANLMLGLPDTTGLLGS
ncbi:N-acetyl-gamma-glutamyl-phosphate reductase [Planctobacterium marinum]|uniref:N-acetyl-gamma-glutamyl-phosphate reductase n=2 Tax=Planctobacterium marinum TaxID=1631968 RepID=A0AA48HN13_9ALTE|nr:N-acetyl-gamma-glutamyl-phosphate reductase [Planctobacterium marinum]